MNTLYHSSFASIEGGMVHYKNHIGQDDFRKKVENGIGKKISNYKNIGFKIKERTDSFYETFVAMCFTFYI